MSSDRLRVLSERVGRLQEFDIECVVELIDLSCRLGILKVPISISCSVGWTVESELFLKQIRMDFMIRSVA